MRIDICEVQVRIAPSIRRRVVSIGVFVDMRHIMEDGVPNNVTNLPNVGLPFRMVPVVQGNASDVLQKKGILGVGEVEGILRDVGSVVREGRVSIII